MLHPYQTHKDLDADGLRAVVALRDEAIQIAKVSKITLSASSRQTVTVDDNPTPQPLKVVAGYLRAPSAFLAMADVGLAQHIVDHQLNKVKNDREIVFRSGKAVGDQAAGRIRLSGSTIVDRLIANVGDTRRANFYDMGNYADISIVGSKMTLKPKPSVDDITEGGFRVLYSEIMARAPSIEPYIERLVCTNGMVCRQHVQSFQFDTLDQFLDQFNFSIQKSNEIVDSTIRAQLAKAAETKVDRSEQAIRTIFANGRINPRLLSPSIAALMEEDDGTAFGVLQALTRAANALPYSHRLLLQETGAKEMARLDVAHCPTCWSSAVH